MMEFLPLVIGIIVTYGIALFASWNRLDDINDYRWKDWRNRDKKIKWQYDKPFTFKDFNIYILWFFPSVFALLAGYVYVVNKYDIGIMSIGIPMFGGIFGLMYIICKSG